MINKNVVNFPVITLEELSKKVNSAVMWLSKYDRYLICFWVVNTCVSGAMRSCIMGVSKGDVGR
ncbi:MAG: hypothetical protein J7L52_03135 [Thermotogae bacterium]|nr:hypothetical protein [Thermotogota bacterium]